MSFAHTHKRRTHTNLSPFDPLQSAFYSHLVFWPSRQVLLLYTYKSNSAFGGAYIYVGSKDPRIPGMCVCVCEWGVRVFLVECAKR